MGSTRTTEWPTCQWNCTFPWNLIPQILVPVRLCFPLLGPFPNTSSLPPLRHRPQPQAIISEWPSSPVSSHLISECQQHCCVLRPSLVKYHHSDAALTWLAGEWPAWQIDWHYLWILILKIQTTTQALPPHHPPHYKPFPSTPTDFINPNAVHTSWKNKSQSPRYSTHQSEEQLQQLYQRPDWFWHPLKKTRALL